MADKTKDASTEKAAEETDTSPLVNVKAIRSFQGSEGFKNPASDPFQVSKERADQLKEAGLVEFVEAEAK